MSVFDFSYFLFSNWGFLGNRFEVFMIFDVKYLWLEFSYFVESFVLIVEEVMDVCCVLVKVEMEKFL